MPRDSDADKVLALVGVWSAWAGDPAPQQRYWRDLVEAAQPVRARRQVESRAIRSAYLQQVMRIAPPDPPGLVGREAELAELAAFCLDADRGPYAWWQAGAWSGKTALMSTFVLHPPQPVRERVWIVSFFVTGRLAAQDTREAFVQVLLEQLAGLTGQEVPAVLPEATREGFLLDLLTHAARTCQRAGRRLVLVVDGLDEDRGVTAGPQAHSIAALLPADPPCGMRVIVAGRPSPPVPDDVPGWHPLRDERVIRPLDASAFARYVQRLARQELKRLQNGTPVEQDVLGLLTAARGGLTCLDLEELTGAPLGQIEEILYTVAGRTFARRASRRSSADGPEGYLLGHEELQAAAARYFGRRLEDYHERLHEWADAYRAQAWPPGTPEYLLSGYYRLLVTLGDLQRMIACAGDAARHDRMMEATGGDVAALAEIRTALDLIAAQDSPDLARALALACHRDLLTNRNMYIPVRLPAVWAALGQVTRAQALATSLMGLDLQAEALAQIAEVLAGAGQHEQAEAVARSIPTYYPHHQAGALAQVAEALAAAGQHEQAEVVARSITDEYRQALALEKVVRALGAVGQHKHAERVTRSFTGPYLQAKALAGAGKHEQAEAVARSITDPHLRAQALASVAEELARTASARAGAGQREQAARVAGQAEAVARSITDEYVQVRALAWVVEALAAAGQLEQAEAFARSITGSHQQAQSLARVAEVLAGLGQREQATKVAGQAEAVARAITNRAEMAEALAQVVGALAKAGQLEQAEAVARSIPTNRCQQADALARAAEALVKSGQLEQAIKIAGQAEAVARSRPDWDLYLYGPALEKVAGALAKAGRLKQAEAVAQSISCPHLQADALVQVAGALAKAGQFKQAEAVTRSITDEYMQMRALAAVAGALTAKGQYEQAASVVGRAEATARSITHPGLQMRALAAVAGALAGAGKLEQAEAVARSITSPDQQAKALTQVAGAQAEAGQLEPAEAIANSFANPELQAEALAQVAGALADAAQHDKAVQIAGQAEAVARSITTNPHQQVNLLVRVARALSEAEQPEQAARVAGHAEAVAYSNIDPDLRVSVLEGVAGALAGAGQFERAEAVARSINILPMRADALAQVAEALARAGWLERAEVVARSIADADQQASALALVAEALADTGDIHSARNVAAAACAAGRWAASAAVVLLLDPSAFAALAGVLEERLHMQLSQYQ